MLALTWHRLACAFIRWSKAPPINAAQDGHQTHPCKPIKSTRTDIESAAFEGEGVHIDDLQPGDRVEVTWLPNRRCVFRYEGDARFTVVEAEHSKLQVGDTFETAAFLIGQPMYLDNLCHADRSSNADQPPTADGMSYVAGSKHGLHTVVRLIDA